MITIRLPDRPWPIDWEQRPGLDECMHDWETVRAEALPRVFELVERCRSCRAPRCDRRDPDAAPGHATRCFERRHHRTVHIFASGRFQAVGG